MSKKNKNATWELITGIDIDSDKEVRERVVVLKNRVNRDYLELGRLLYYIGDRELYKEWDNRKGGYYKTFKEYVECEVNFSFRKSKVIMNIWWWFGEQLKCDEKAFTEVCRLGWTKAYFLVGVAGRETLSDWVSKIESVSQKQAEKITRDALKGRKRGEGNKRSARKPAVITHRGDIINVVTQGLPAPKGIIFDFKPRFTVVLPDKRSRQIIESAIELAASMFDAREPCGTGELLTYIANDFLKRYTVLRKIT